MAAIIECRFCREVYNADPEQIGARCTTCRMPLFERPPRRRPGYDLGPCALHPEVEAYGKCRRCGKLMCHICRTRWYDMLVCPGCLSQMLDGKGPNPRDERIQRRLAVWSLVWGLAAWGLLLLTLLPLRSMYTSAPSSSLRWLAMLLFLGSLIPAFFAAGQALSVIRLRTEHLRTAVAGLCLGGSHIGVLLGMLLLNLWYN